MVHWRRRGYTQSLGHFRLIWLLLNVSIFFLTPHARMSLSQSTNAIYCSHVQKYQHILYFVGSGGVNWGASSSRKLTSGSVNMRTMPGKRHALDGHIWQCKTVLRRTTSGIGPAPVEHTDVSDGQQQKEKASKSVGFSVHCACQTDYTEWSVRPLQEGGQKAWQRQ